MKERSFKMIVSIKNDDGVTSYDVAKIEDEQARANANVTISKVSQLEVVMEALSFASAAHRGNLEKLFADTPEALVEQEEEEVVNTDSE
jgi:hypothetical protein|tara:strand:+ start:2868 stop:3134 length:267 start_codon:yes stop_codon:yes gene_type:complete